MGTFRVVTLDRQFPLWDLKQNILSAKETTLSSKTIFFFVLCFLLVRNQFYSFFFTLWHFKLVLVINRGHARSEKANGK